MATFREKAGNTERGGEIGYFKRQHQTFTAIWGAGVKQQRLCPPICSPVVQEQGSGCVKNGQFVCLPWQQPPTPSPQPPVSCPSGHSGVKGDCIDVENHPFCFVFLSSCHILVSFPVCLQSYCLSLSLSLYCIQSCCLLDCLALSLVFLSFFFYSSSACRLFVVILLHYHPWTVPYIWIFAFVCIPVCTYSTCVCLASLLKSS